MDPIGGNSLETLKFGLKYLKGSVWKLVVSEVLSFVGILGDLFIPLVTGILIDFVIKDSEVTEKSGGVFHFLLSGKYGEEKDFTAIIEQAKNCKPPEEIETGKIIGGFAHEQVFDSE